MPESLRIVRFHRKGKQGMASWKLKVAIVGMSLLAAGSGIAFPLASASAAHRPVAQAPHIVGVFPTNMSGNSSGGYILYNNGRVVPLAGAPYYGAGTPTKLKDFVGLITDQLGNGYWLVTSTGAHYSLGTTCSDGQVLQGPKYLPNGTKIIGAINAGGDGNEGFDLVSSTDQTFSYQCNFSF